MSGRARSSLVRRVRRSSVFSDSSTEPEPLRRDSTAAVGAGVLLTLKAEEHFSTQVLLGNVAPTIYFATFVFDAERHRALRLNHAAAMIALLCVLALALACKLRASLPASWRPSVALMFWAETFSQMVLTLGGLHETLWLHPDRYVSLSTPGRAAIYFYAGYIALIGKWVITQTPAQVVFFPEALRAGLYGVVSLYFCASAGTLSVRVVLALALRCVAGVVLPLALVTLCQEKLFLSWHATLGAGLETCPKLLRPLRAKLLDHCNALADALLPDGEPLIDSNSILGIHGGVLTLVIADGMLSSNIVACRAVNIVSVMAAVLTLASKMRNGSAASMRLMQSRLGLEHGPGTTPLTLARARRNSVSTLVRLHGLLSTAGSEEEMLRRGATILHDLFPGAVALAVLTLDEDGVTISSREVAAAEEADRAALSASLPMSLAPGSDGDGSSAAFVCSGRPTFTVAHSDDWPGGCAEFTDWAAAASEGLRCSQRVTARLTAGTMCMGFVCLAYRDRPLQRRMSIRNTLADMGLSSQAGAHAGFASDDAEAADELRKFCAMLGDCIFERRSRSAIEQAEKERSKYASLARDVFPDHILHTLSSRLRSDREGDAPEDLLTDHYPDVTCIFADIAGFTRIASCLSSEDTMQLLDSLFQRFDALTTAHGIFKVETVGDMYFCVSGMLPARPDHARAALRFALDLHEAARATLLPVAARAACDHVQIRVGLHNGPVTTGVIGHLRARFCIFGDTVNVASRMESGGRVDCVQLSSIAHAACALPPGLIPHRLLDVRGKGHMTTFVLPFDGEEAAAVRRALAVGPPPSRLNARRRWALIAASLRNLPAIAAAGEPPGSERLARISGVTSAGPGADVTASAPEVAKAPTVTFGTSVSDPGPGSIHGSSAEFGRSEGVELMRRLGQSHLVAQLSALWTPPMLYHGMMAFRTDRWRERGGEHTLAILAVYRSLWLLVISISTFVGALFALRSMLPRKVATFMSLRWGAVIVAMQVILMLHMSTAHVFEYIMRPQQDACPPGSPFACIRVPFIPIQFMFSPTLWLQAQLPLRLVVFPELLRNALYAAAALLSAGSLGTLSSKLVGYVLLESLAASLAVVILLGFSYKPSQACELLLATVDSCPPPLRGMRDALCSTVLRWREALFNDNCIIDEQGSFMLSCLGMYIVAQTCFNNVTYSLKEIAYAFNSTMGLILCAGAATQLRPTADAASLNELAARLDAAAEQRILRELRENLGTARSEAAMLRATSDALGALFPGAAAWAVGAFAEGAGCDLVTALEAGPEDAKKAMLLAALPPTVGALTAAGDATTSVAAACHGMVVQALASSAWAGASRVLDSKECIDGLLAFTDWAEAAAAGLPTAQAVTVPLTAGPRVVGFVQLHFGVYATRRTNNFASVLTELVDALGGALFVGRAFALSRDPSGPVAPPTASVARAPAGSAATAAAIAVNYGDAPYPASEADAAALAALDEAAAVDWKLLRNDWGLDPWTMPDDEVRRLLLAIFHAAGLLRSFRLSPTAFATFIADVAAHMNDNVFHNFRHIFMVTHTAYLLLHHSHLHPSLLTDGEALALLLGAVCHDLEHPGLTNAWHVQTRHPLALRYHDTSVLENHHACVAFTLLERAGIFSGMPPADKAAVRKTLVAAILATDMRVHGDLLARVNGRISAARAEAAATKEEAERDGPAPGGRDSASNAPLVLNRRSSTAATTAAHVIAAGAFKPELEEDRCTLVCFLLHSADLCCPLLPPPMSRRISTELELEFSKQAALEKAAGLPVSVMLSNGDVAKASNELGFIKAVVAPLYRTLADLCPSLRLCLTLIDTNVQAWSAVIENEAAANATAARRASVSK